MKKTPTYFDRDWEGDRSRVVNKVHAGCEWVAAGEGVATQKVDGTSCMIRAGAFYKRREIRAGQMLPPDFEIADRDEETGKSVGWVPVGDGPDDRYHREAYERGMPLADGTYELVGPKIQGNPEKAPTHQLWAHSLLPQHHDAPRDFDGLKAWLTGKDIEGLVWHHPDGRMAKIKLRDFGLKRQP